MLDAQSGALGQSASASVLVITTAPQLSAVIDTGGQQVLSSLEPFYLSALASTSSDGDTTDSGIREEDLQFAWTCSRVDPDKFGMACPIKVGLPSLAGFTVPANLITFGTEQLLFEVPVINQNPVWSLHNINQNPVGYGDTYECHGIGNCECFGIYCCGQYPVACVFPLRDSHSSTRVHDPSTGTDCGCTGT